LGFGGEAVVFAGDWSDPGWFRGHVGLFRRLGSRRRVKIDSRDLKLRDERIQRLKLSLLPSNSARPLLHNLDSLPSQLQSPGPAGLNLGLLGNPPLHQLLPLPLQFGRIDINQLPLALDQSLVLGLAVFQLFAGVLYVAGGGRVACLGGLFLFWLGGRLLGEPFEVGELGLDLLVLLEKGQGDWVWRRLLLLYLVEGHVLLHYFALFLAEELVVLLLLGLIIWGGGLLAGLFLWFVGLGLCFMGLFDRFWRLLGLFLKGFDFFWERLGIFLWLTALVSQLFDIIVILHKNI
jgi:hypothetical protein